MKKHIYYTKDVCNIFDINRETLRHYERLGLLNPHINPNNGYREYGSQDIATIIDILKYRALGYSLADAKDAVFNFDQPKIIESLEEHIEYYQNKLFEYSLLFKKAQNDLAAIRNSEYQIGEFFETTVEEAFFVPYSANPKDPYFSSMQKAISYSQFFTTALIINEHNELEMMGFVTDVKFSSLLNIGDGITLKKARAAAQVIDYVGNDFYDGAVFADFREKISQKYSRSFENINAILISRFYDKEKVYHQYFLAIAILE